MSVLYDYVCSDHRPLSAVLCNVSVNLTHAVVSNNSDDVEFSHWLPDWSRLTEAQCNEFSCTLHTMLDNISIPRPLVGCCGNKCSSSEHNMLLNDYYNDIIQAVKLCVEMIVPKRQLVNTGFNVPGWNDFVQEKYEASRAAFLEWAACGKPRFGGVFECMSRCRASFKLALRYCRQHEDEMRADACARALDLGDTKQFWKKVKHMGNDKATKYASCVGGVTGDSNIAEMWKNHYANLYNSVNDGGSRERFYDRIGDNMDVCHRITPVDIVEVCRSQKRGKGPDGVHMEAFVIGCPKLYVHLSVLLSTPST